MPESRTAEPMFRLLRSMATRYGLNKLPVFKRGWLGADSGLRRTPFNTMKAFRPERGTIPLRNAETYIGGLIYAYNSYREINAFGQLVPEFLEQITSEQSIDRQLRQMGGTTSVHRQHERGGDTRLLRDIRDEPRAGSVLLR